MALLSSQSGSIAGAALTYSNAAGGGDTFANTGKERIHVKNGGGSSITVTIAAQQPCSFGVDDVAHDVTVSIAAGADRLIGPFDKAQFNDDSGIAHIAYSGVTSVTIAVVK